MSTETRTELDAQTIEELRPVCQGRKLWKGTNEVAWRCRQPAEFACRFPCPCCGIGSAALLCAACLSSARNAAEGCRCPRCMHLHAGVALSVEPIGGKS